MHELLTQAPGERMTLADYRLDFAREFWQTGRPGFWKLERQQFFQEPGYRSWEAFARGDWAEALALLERDRPQFAAEHRRATERGFTIRRVRVVEEPIIPYLQWELHVLRVREQCGTEVRVVNAEQVAAYETAGPLPEVCTLGHTVMYEIVYDHRGILDGGRKFTDPALILRWQRLIADLYSAGEPLADYFTRRVAPLPAPTFQQAT